MQIGKRPTNLVPPIIATRHGLPEWLPRPAEPTLVCQIMLHDAIDVRFWKAAPQRGPTWRRSPQGRSPPFRPSRRSRLFTAVRPFEADICFTCKSKKIFRSGQQSQTVRRHGSYLGCTGTHGCASISSRFSNDAATSTHMITTSAKRMSSTELRPPLERSWHCTRTGSAIPSEKIDAATAFCTKRRDQIVPRLIRF